MLAAVLAIELFVFNYRHWASPIGAEIPAGRLNLGTGYQDNGNGTYTVVGDDLYIEIPVIGQKLSTACIELALLDKADETPRPISLKQWATDESHKLYYGLPEREIWENERRSSYITYHLYGKCTSLMLLPGFAIGQTVSVAVTLNPRIPLFLSWERLLLLLLLFGVISALKPSSPLHRIPYLGLNYRTMNVLLVVFFLAHGAILGGIVGVNPFFQEESVDNQRQYQMLAESLKEGRFFLKEEPPLALQKMENPYDYEYRNQVMGQSGEWYKWDHAYFNGKYYVYFGVVPAALLYFPYYLFTGTHLHNYQAVFFFALLFLAGTMGVVHGLIRKWFPRTSLGMWFLLMEGLFTGSGIIYMAKRPDLYTVPILAGLAFGMLGLWFFLLAGQAKQASCKYLAAGSLFLALVAGCRPQLFVFTFAALLLLGRRLVWAGHEGTAFSLPMLLVAAVLMYYNYSRFGSVFDFGANYNLTFNDMRRRGFQFDRIPLGIMAYLFQPIRMGVNFPFVEAVYFDSQYMGVTIQEATYGGLFKRNLFAWFGLLPVFLHKECRSQGKRPWLLAVLCLALAGIIIIVDTNMSGILQRYFGDFSIFIMLSATVALLLAVSCLEGAGGERVKGILIWLLIFCLLWETAYQFLVFFLDTGEALRDLRPDLYSHAKYLTAFWM